MMISFAGYAVKKQQAFIDDLLEEENIDEINKILDNLFHLSYIVNKEIGE